MSKPGESPGGRPMGAIGVTLITIYLALVTVVVFCGLVVVWPSRDTNLEVILDRIDEVTADQDQTTGSEKSGGASTGASGNVGDGTGESSTGVPGTSGPSVQTQGTEPKRGTGAVGDSGSTSLAKEQDGETCADCEPLRGKPWQKLFGADFCLRHEERLFLIVMFAGALGGLVHAFRSFLWYAGCRKLVLSWAGFYFTLPILGAALATVFYLVVRGGLFSPESEISDTSPFGFAALAALIGMFTEQAAGKLKQIAETTFARVPPGPNDAGSETAALTLAVLDPTQGPKAGGTPVKITGSGFAEGAIVTFGGQPATSIQVATDGASITANTPAASGPGSVLVEVTNTDGTKGSLANGFTYHAGSEPAALTVAGLDPTQGPMAGGTAVKITGSGFAQGAAVTFGFQTATSIQVATDGTTIAAATPSASDPGSVTVEVTNPDGTKGSLANGFTYV